MFGRCCVLYAAYMRFGSPSAEGLPAGLLALASRLVSRRERLLDLPDGDLEEVIVVLHAGFEVTPLFHAYDVGEGDAGDDLIHPGQAVEVRHSQFRLCLAEGCLEVDQAGLLRDAVDLRAILIGHLLGGSDAVLQHLDLLLDSLLLGHVYVLRVFIPVGFPPFRCTHINSESTLYQATKTTEDTWEMCGGCCVYYFVVVK